MADPPFVDQKIRNFSNEASSCPGIFSRTLWSYYVANSPSFPLPCFLDGHRAGSCRIYWKRASSVTNYVGVATLNMFALWVRHLRLIDNQSETGKWEAWHRRAIWPSFSTVCRAYSGGVSYPPSYSLFQTSLPFSPQVLSLKRPCLCARERVCVRFSLRWIGFTGPCVMYHDVHCLLFLLSWKLPSTTTLFGY